jgi:hypothetical protein
LWASFREAKVVWERTMERRMRSVRDGREGEVRSGGRARKVWRRRVWCR